MTARIILCRHGNTFSSDQIPYMVGCREDLELTQRGCEQAVRVGEMLKKNNVVLSRILSAPLKRTRCFGEIIQRTLGEPLTPLCFDDRLAELDYGGWAGKTNEEIVRSGGAQQLQDWNACGKWPSSVTFMPTEEVVMSEVQSILKESENDTKPVCVVTSNGRIKTFARILGKESELKMGTGMISLLRRDGITWSIECWNKGPEDLNITLFS